MNTVLNQIKTIIANSLKQLNYPNVDFSVDLIKLNKFGDFSTNVAMLLKKHLPNDKPEIIAQKIADAIKNDLFEKIEIAKPGFINFTLSSIATKYIINQIASEKDSFPKFNKLNEYATVEYVSANPTGHLHIGHARNAVLGESISLILEKVGYDVIRDYVINDAGNQINILAASVLVRYKQLLGQNIQLPEDSYHGSEIKDVADALFKKYKDQFLNTEINDQFQITDNETRIIIRKFSVDFLLNQIQKDLASLNVKIDEYFSEQTTHDHPERIEQILKQLSEYVYVQDGATWFKSTEFGDDKDRVLIKSNGEKSYFLPDIYYHNWKITRHPNITRAVIILGSDHYGYYSRLMAVLTALGHKNISNWYQVVFMQMVKLVKNGEDFKMSKRSGQSLKLSDLVNALGPQIATWYLISKSADTHLIIDVDEALSEGQSNSFYYIKSAYEKMINLLQKANFSYQNNIDFNKLDLSIERDIINQLHYFAQTISFTAKSLDLLKIVNYIVNLSQLFHSYYEQNKIINLDNQPLTQQRLSLVWCLSIVYENALKLINIRLK